MKSFAIKKLNDKYEFESFNYDIQGLSYPIKKGKQENLKITNLVIVNPDMISALISKQFQKKFQRIIDYFFTHNDFDDDSTGTNLMLALDEIARLRTLLIKKYNNLLKKKKEEELLKKLKVLENEVRMKMIDFKLIKEQELTKEEKNKTR